MILLAFLLSYAAFVWLSLAMNRHHQQVAGRPVTRFRQRIFRLAGSALLLLSLWPVVAGWGLSVGLAVWLALITVTGQLQVLLLTYRPRWTRTLSVGSGLAALLILPFVT